MLLVLPLALLVLNGCASKQVVLYPIEKTDIFSIEQGTKIGDITIEKDGWFISDFYLNEVMDAKLE